ncbi:BPSS1780 family membrane protein [Massilia sp. TSP1-1-2]|uniref:BPSS1780 family membrane protein n=1 Tax=unclassified Massilia TaxID=2609279 RepID=UPI003CEB6B43
MKGLPARTGIDWLKQGFGLFKQQPGILMMLIFANFMVTILLVMLPVLGVIVAYLAMPSFTMAIQQSCRMIDNGERVHPRVLLTGFQKEAIGPLFKLGLVYLGIVIVLALAVIPFIDIEAVKAAMKMMEAKKQPVVDGRTALAFTMFFLVLAVSTLLLSFAPGLTYWKRMPTFKAIFYSVFAVLGSKAPIAVMLVVWIALSALLHQVFAMIFGTAAIAQVIGTWITFVSILIFQCATYAAYKQILGAPEDAPKAAR